MIRLRPRKRATSEPVLTLLAIGAIVLLAGLLIVMAGAVMGYGYYLLDSRIFPGVHVGDIDLSGMTSAQAAPFLERTWSLETSVLVTNGIQNQQLSPLQFGISLDTRQTIQHALKIGRSGAIFERLEQVFSSLVDQQSVEPVVSLDADAARQALQDLTAQMSQPAVDATIQAQGADLVAIPARLGYTINVNATLQMMQNDPAGIIKSSLLTIIPQPVAPVVTDAAPALQEARALLAKPAEVLVYDPISNEQTSYPIPSETIASWLRVSQGSQGPQVNLDEAGVSSFLSQLSSQIGEGRSIDPVQNTGSLVESLRQGKPILVKATHPATSYTVQSGDTLLKISWRVGVPYWMIVNANPGMNPDQLSAGAILTIPSKDELLPLPVVANKRIIIDLTRQRMTVYQDGQQINQFVISTGIDRSPTQPGVFQVQTHDPNAYASVWDLYMPDFLGIYEAWPGFMNGIHGLPLLSSGVRMWANSLGRPASYGCIILGLKEAKWLYGWAEDGVIVEIRA